jgi:hypothetical protein
VAQPRRIKLWQLILAGPFLIWSGIHSYNRLDAFEQSGGTIYLGRTDHLLYQLGGKTFVLVFWLGLGALYVWALFRFLRFEREARQAEDRAQASDEARGRRPAPAAAPVAPPRPSPPRLGNDPFRDPPRAPVVVAQQTAAPATPTKIVAGDPADKPKLLT